VCLQSVEVRVYESKRLVAMSKIDSLVYIFSVGSATSSDRAHEGIPLQLIIGRLNAIDIVAEHMASEILLAC
jgi:hypothetical protein